MNLQPCAHYAKFMSTTREIGSLETEVRPNLDQCPKLVARMTQHNKSDFNFETMLNFEAEIRQITLTADKHSNKRVKTNWP